MAAPHPMYPHQGPGPSSYYQPSPPPSQYVYGAHSPGPGPSPSPYHYQYPGPPPPHMAAHHPGLHQQSTSPRMNGRGGGAYTPHSSSRGGQNYQPFHPHQHQPYPHPHPHVNQLAVQAPHPQHHQQHNPYAHLPTKYPQTYSPSYGFPPPAAPYSPSWQAQTLSPLPKQLSMPPPRGISPGYHEPLPAPQPQNYSQLAEEISINVPPSIVDSSPPSVPPSPSPRSSPQPSYTQMGTISSSSVPSSPVAQSYRPLSPSSPKLASANTSLGSWAIWSRRPDDPSHAPGIIISPRARPPPGIVQGALELRTPPRSPPRSPAVSVKGLPAPSNDATFSKLQQTAGEEEISSPSQDDSKTSSTVPSSSVTETTDTPTIPGSPVSTNTSISLTGASPKEPAPQAPEAPAPASSEPAASSPPSASSQSAHTAAPAPAVAAAVPLVKKSWASLLRPSSSSTPGSSSAPTSTKNTLPTSSVVGFSIPAEPTPTALPVSPSKKSELLSLLTTGPTGASAGNDRIRPRGLVNSGNMCFANSVLQVLVYCAPFHRLFVELGRVLLGPVAGEEKDGGTPLVDATVEFLREYVGDEKEKAKEAKKAAGVNGSGGSGGRGKGKEREREVVVDEDDWDGESFIPTSVYDAMKEKKRFDNMRGGHQEDAEEFLGFYLDTLEEELLAIVNSISPRSTKAAPAPVEEKEEAAPPEGDGWLEVGKRNRMVVTRTIRGAESPITRIFGGKFRSTLRAPHQKDSVIVEDWRSLRLDIQRDKIETIQDALSYISFPQPVQVTNPTRPGVTIEASQQVLIEALPPVLVLHVKRFCYDIAVGGVVKVGKHVRFGPELEIGPELMAPTTKKSQPTRYKLFGALYHHGLSALGGHYTLDVLHPNRYPSASPTAKPREGWVRIDDELVSDVRPEDVFGVSDRDDSRCAYLLFYRRVR